MGFFSSIISSAVKVGLSPIAIFKDAASIVAGEEPEGTKELLESAGDDVKEAFDSIT